MLFAMFVLAIALGIGLSVSALIINQVKMAVDAGQSVAAFYAADAGAEKCLYQVRTIDPPDGVNYPCSVSGGNLSKETLSNGLTTFEAKRESETSLISTGNHAKTSRSIRLDW